MKMIDEVAKAAILGVCPEPDVSERLRGTPGFPLADAGASTPVCGCARNRECVSGIFPAPIAGP